MADGREEREEQKKRRELEEREDRLDRLDRDWLDRDRPMLERHDESEPERGGS
jgi:hypothetical protein